jgi:hypothetical protein
VQVKCAQTLLLCGPDSHHATIVALLVALLDHRTLKPLCFCGPETQSA